MKYIYLNRAGVVVDILDEVRYIRLNPISNIVIGCKEDEGTGVIGSDCDTHYVLMKSDTTNSPDAVRVLSYTSLPSEVKAGYYKFENGELVPRYNLEERQAQKQEENKTLFAEYLASHPMTWVDGKTYGITEEDQSEISLNIAQYQIAVNAGQETPTLEWHAQKEECVDWTIEQLSALSLAISAAVYPVYHLMQQYKTAIYSATTPEEVDAIVLNYEMVE